VTIITPAFEAIRAKGLPLAADTVNWAEWAEDASPYAVAIKAAGGIHGPIYVDDMTRHFIVAGLQGATNASVESTPPAVRQIRERKSAHELALLKCANEVQHIAGARI